MNDHKILEELLNDIENMSVEDLKASLFSHSYGPIHNIMTFDPYEALFHAYAESSYKLVGETISCLQKCEFIKQVKELDVDRSVAKLVTSAANDESYDFLLAA
jgi:hypothetical protein